MIVILHLFIQYLLDDIYCEKISNKFAKKFIRDFLCLHFVRRPFGQRDLGIVLQLTVLRSFMVETVRLISNGEGM